MKRLEIINFVVGLVAVTLLLVAGIYLKKLVSPDVTDLIEIPANKHCDLGIKACEVKQDNLTIKLHLKPPLKYLGKINIDLQMTGLENKQVEKVLIEFTMPDMEMGINRFELSKGLQPGLWQGIAILPVCVSGRKDWHVSLYIKTSDKTYRVRYYLGMEA